MSGPSPSGPSFDGDSNPSVPFRGQQPLPSAAAAAPAPTPAVPVGGAAAMGDSSSNNRVSFVCQRCLSPLQIDPSFYTMNEHTLAELRLTISPTPDFDPGDPPSSDGDKRQPPHRLSVPPSPFRHLQDSGGGNHGFTLVDETGGETPTSSLGRKLRTTAELFDLISNNGDIDHPLCEECTDALLDAMDQQLKLSEEEAQEYQAYLQKLDQETEDDGRVADLEKELAALQTDESRLKDELGGLKTELAEAEAELQSQLAEKARLERDEQKYWKEYSKHKRELLNAEDNYRSLDCRLRYTQSQIDKLKKMNVFTASFHIWHVGHFATINGFRLGRLPSVPVEWAEINAAWGQTALLLTCLAKAVGMDGFQRFQVVPYGNYSYVKVLDDDKVLRLYGTGGFRRIFDSNFDQAMVAFLDCLQQFATEVERLGFSLPYEMDKGKIRDNNTGQYFPVKLQFNSEDLWTKALRYMLTNLKWGLAFVSTKYMKQ